ncbi:MAG: hypothetical protein DUD33_10800 [Coriobacteriaceae bacterium]|jgi:hypothetical protein|nr:MAG: hypothetical protein DUD33_10800 [Coriobacteriaceae bacterium]
MSQHKPAASEGAKPSAGEKNEATSPKAGARQAGAKAPRTARVKSDAAPRENAEFLRAENEDDDGYDPYSDRRPSPEPLFERDPWD